MSQYSPILARWYFLRSSVVSFHTVVSLTISRTQSGLPWTTMYRPAGPLLGIKRARFALRLSQRMSMPSGSVFRLAAALLSKARSL